MVADAQPQKPRHERLLYVVAVLTIGLAALLIVRAWPSWFASAPPAEIVKASGRIEGREMTVAPKDIQGRVKRLYADEGETVTAGQRLADLEATQLEARAASLSASIAAIDAQIRQALMDVDLTSKNSDASIDAAVAGVSLAQARLTRANAVLANATAEYDQERTLFARGVTSGRDRDRAELTFRTSQADVDAAAKDLARAEADLALARASTDTIALKRQYVRTLEQSRRSAAGQLAEAEANLAERRIVAPADGTILSRTVEVGDVVSPGAPMFRLVDLNRLYVKVYVPEPEIPSLRLGDPADVSVDAFRNRRFIAHVSKIYDEAEFTPKNVETAEERLKLVFGVELSLVNTERLLKPGMPADCVIHTGTADTDARRNGS